MNKWSLVLLILTIVSVYSQQGATNDDAQFAGMRRTACLVLSRYHSNTQKDTIESVVQSLSPQNQQKYINKIYAVAVTTCEPLINQSQVQQLFVQNQQFDPNHLFHLFETVDYAAIANEIDTPLNPLQESIVKFAKLFDEQMAIRRQEKQATQSGPSEINQMKIFGISFHNMSGFTKFLYVGIFASIIGAFLFYGFQKLDGDKKDKKQKKKSKSPKKE